MEAEKGSMTRIVSFAILAHFQLIEPWFWVEEQLVMYGN